ncbi:LexA family protein [Streptomyces alfalfae]
MTFPIRSDTSDHHLARTPGTGAERAHQEAGVRRVPLLTRLPATTRAPVAWEEAETVLPLPTELLGDGELVAVRMEGPAMTGAGIREGDVLTVCRQSSAAHGDVVAARVGGETVIRRLAVDDGQVRLVACNPGYSPVHASAGVVLGRVVAVLRKL